MSNKSSMEKIINKLHELDPKLDKGKLQQILMNESGMKINTKPDLDHKEKVLDRFNYEGKEYWRCNDDYLWNDDCDKVGCVKNGKVYLYSRKAKKFKTLDELLKDKK